MFTPTRAAALDALELFLPHAGRDYARDRNHDTGLERTNVSRLSPYLRHRLLTEHEVVAAVLARHRLPDCEKFVQEVFWRTYWKGWLEQNPEVWHRYRREVGEFWLDTDAVSSDYRHAVTGRSGIDAMDAWVSELVITGYLHNHTRMWFASIWIFTLRLPWQLGADFFYRHLLDGDAASNTLSWRWVAGLQTAGKTYLATAENISRYTDGRFAPTGLATSDRALVEDPLPPRSAASVADPITRVGRIGLLLHEEDLDAASLGHDHPWLTPELQAFGTGHSGGEVVATAAFADPADRSPASVSDAVHSFTAGALEDAASRGRSSPSRPATVLPDTLDSTVLRWAESERLDAVVVPAAPVGPVQERLAALGNALASEGLTMTTVTRRWDALAWPHASRGFFAFRERIPDLLNQQGL
ncbi:DNA photolyase [Subtercola sp. PAMC28395]|uniref:FAD-binding domain-containing protein n=1 Tax=Subtercola sp. PAMC28395 TaxID=2846775 RepID=UPI001C0DA35C|nr:FAD-binding domain-containing protein [Subtercola sp. PAMC28395]QWT23958.1 DNA photolyase [Subtercola sp. PAMC28395]